MLDNPRVFEEDPADEFYKEKCEVNHIVETMCEKEDFDVDFFIKKIYELGIKLQELEDKGDDFYGQGYGNLNLENKVVLSSSLSIILEKRLEEIFETITSNTDRSMLLQLFKDEDILRTIDSELNKFIPNKFTPGISFKIDRKYVIMTRDILGEYEPITLKNTINLARDYSVLGDSKTALEVEENLLPKIKRTFGDKSVEMVELLEMMATDYKILGNYGKSEESLLKAIEINKALYGDESSPKLLANLVNLINLRRVILKTDDPLYIALEKAAKNTSENDLSKSGYFRILVMRQNVT